MSQIGRLKQLFVLFAKTLFFSGGDADIQATLDALRGRNVPSIQWKNVYLKGKHAEDYFSLLEQFVDLLKPDGHWGRDSVGTILMEAISGMMASPQVPREDAIRAAADSLVERLKTPPTTWEVDIEIAGTQPDCAGHRFGAIEFVLDRAVRTEWGLQEGGNRGTVDLMYARTSIQAIDAPSATESASRIIDEHLSVLNAICGQGLPSRTHLYTGHNRPHIHTISSRIRKLTDQFPNYGHHRALVATLLSRRELEAFSQLRGGENVSKLLLASTSFSRRIIAAYAISGTAFVEDNPALSYLLFAISLESVILGNQVNAELTYQLSARVAHLIELNPENRAETAGKVKEFYKIRSSIVHNGFRDVKRDELHKLATLTLQCLTALASRQEFAAMVEAKELDRWFDSRMLGQA